MEIRPEDAAGRDAGEDVAAPSAVEEAVALIRQALVSGRFAPGARLKVAEVSRELGISTMPVREALRLLEGEGILRILPNRGAVVRPVDGEFLEHLYEVRTALAELALRRAIPRLTLTKLRLLESICDDHEHAVARDDLVAALTTGRRLHVEIFAIAGNDHARRIFERDWELVQALRLKFGYLPGRMTQIAEEQRMLVRALRDGDLTAATNILRMHNQAGLEDLLARLGSG
jgi:DNA-binding GntR family transcriptional regulator